VQSPSEDLSLELNLLLLFHERALKIRLLLRNRDFVLSHYGL
jgi:hypothetical protein